MSEHETELATMVATLFEGNRTAGMRDVWAQLDELGLARLTAPEDEGGSGGTWADAALVLGAAAASGVATPLAESDLLAGWLLRAVGLPVDESLRTVCVVDGSGTAYDVPWGAEADRIVVVAGGRVADLDRADVEIAPGVNLAGEPRAVVSIDPTKGEWVAVEPALVEAMQLRAALARGIQVTAALERAVEITIRYTQERVQFGRPLAKFQAVQNLVADMAAETALCRATTDAAVRAMDDDGTDPERVRFLVAVARSCSAHATSQVTRSAHQVHGAIGTTMEHRLHEVTAPALAWRSEYGSAPQWDAWLADRAVEAGGDRLWDLITGGIASR